MVTLVPASATITGKAFAAGASAARSVGVMVLAYAMGVGLTVNPLRILAAMAVVTLGAAYSLQRLSMTLAGLVRSRIAGRGSAAGHHHAGCFLRIHVLYPVDVTPSWLHALSTVTRSSHDEVDALRGLLIGTRFNPLDVVVLAVAAVVGPPRVNRRRAAWCPSAADRRGDRFRADAVA